MDMDSLLRTLLVGIGATAVTDVWGWLRQRLFGVPAPNYTLVGRWIAHMPAGRFRHDAITAAAAMPRERAIGWTAHYLIGIGFAFLLLAITGPEWFAQPRLLPALAVGVATVAAPFFVLQPGMGSGIAASRTPRPWHARFHSLVMHAVFGLGLFLTGWLLAAIART